MDKKNIESIFPLTSIQKGLLFHALKDGEAGGYTGRHCLYLKGNIDVDAFKKEHRSIKSEIRYLPNENCIFHTGKPRSGGLERKRYGLFLL